MVSRVIGCLIHNSFGRVKRAADFGEIGLLIDTALAVVTLPAMLPEDASFFDPRSEFGVLNRRLPHWDQAGAWVFVTYRLYDSYPQSLVQEFRAEQSELLRLSGMSPVAGHLED